MNVLVIPHTAWHVPQRFHHFVPHLTDRMHLHATNWDATFSRVSDLFTGRYFQNYLPRRSNDQGVTVHHIPRVTPAVRSLRIQTVNELVFRSAVRRITTRNDVRVAVGSFVTAPPQAVPKVADICDDHVGLWTARGGHPGYAREIYERESAWIRGSRYTVVVSSVLADRVRSENPSVKIVHIPNGVDLKAYVPNRERARAALGLDPDALYVGNVGSLNKLSEARRVAAVAARLSRIPRARLLVVGTGTALPWLQDVVKRDRLSNVDIVGFVSGTKLLNYFQALDVGLCPYSILPGFDSSVPIRLLHYSAVGARVVCPPLKEVSRMRFENVTLAADDDGEFAESVMRVLEAEPSVPDQISNYDSSRLANIYADLIQDASKS